MIGKWHLGSDPHGFDRWEILPGQGAYFDPGALHGDRREDLHRTLRRPTSSPISRSTSSAKRPRDKPFFLMLHHKAPHRPVGARRRARRAVRRPLDPRAGDVLGLVCDADRCAAREPAAHRRRTSRAAISSCSRRRPRAAPRSTAWLGDEAGHRDDHPRRQGASRSPARRSTRWKYQRYMQDYLATVQSVDDSVGRVLDVPRPPRAREEHDRHLHERPGLLPRRPRPLRQALHVRGIAAHAVPRPLAGGDQSRARASDAMALNVDFAPTFLEAAGVAGPGRDAGAQPPAGLARPHAARTGARRCTTATTTTRATTTRARTTACARRRTS